MTRPIGLISRFYLCHENSLGGGLKEIIPEIIAFDLHHHMTLNVSFHYILTSFKISEHCIFGHLTIGELIDQRMKSTVDKDMKHCGLYSKFTLLSFTSIVKISVFLWHNNYLVTSLVYSIRDRNTTSSKLCFNPSHAKPIWIFTFTAQTSSLQIIFLRGDKFQKLHIWVTFPDQQSLYPSPMLRAFDGPGDKCNDLNFISSNTNLLKLHTSTTTFQALLHILNLASYVSFAGSSISSTHVFVEPSLTNAHLLPNVMFCGSSDHCLFSLKTRSTLRINLTMHNFQFSGSRDMGDCTYAGFIIHDPEANYTMTECVPTLYMHWSPQVFMNFIVYAKFANQDQFRSICSHSNEMKLYLFSYKEYANLSVSVVVETTEYPVITIDACQSSELDCTKQEKLVVQITALMQATSFPKQYCTARLFCSSPSSSIATKVNVLGTAVFQNSE